VTVAIGVGAEGGSVRRRGRPANVDTADTIRAILDAARLEFAAHGFTATSNRSVAARAGLAHTAIYNHFGSKAGLFAAVFLDVQDLLIAEMEASAVAAATIDEPAMPRVLVDAIAALGAAGPSYVEFLASMYVEVRRHDKLRDRFQEGPPFSILKILRDLVGADGSRDDELWFWISVALGLAQLASLAAPATVTSAVAGLQRHSGGSSPVGSVGW
jgi:AcrR family transcriptional regulator